MIKTFAFSLLLLTGCTSSAIDSAQTTLVTAHYALLEIDSEFAPLYEKARENARASSSTWEERDKKIEPWEKARKAITATGMSLKAAALSLEIAREGFYSGWEHRMGCLLNSLNQLRETLLELNVKIPISVSRVIEIGKLVAVPCKVPNG